MGESDKMSVFAWIILLPFLVLFLPLIWLVVTCVSIGEAHDSWCDYKSNHSGFGSAVFRILLAVFNVCSMWGLWIPALIISLPSFL